MNKYPVKVTAKTETSGTTLSSGDVTIASADGSTYPEKSFTIGTGGLLIASGDSTIVKEDGINEGTLMLPAGSYKYTIKNITIDGYLANEDGTFTVSDSTSGDYQEQSIVLKKSGGSTEDPDTFSLKLYDGESASGKGALADGPVTVTVGGVEQTCQVSGGVISISTAADSTAKAVTIKRQGYQDITGLNLTFNADGSITGAGLVDGGVTMLQKKTTVDLSAPEGSIITIKKGDQAGDKVTENMESNVLPLSVQAGADGKVSVDLPDGNYTYEIVTPGKETVTGDLDVDVSGAMGGTPSGSVTVTPKDGTATPVTPGTDGTAEVPADKNGADSAVSITDPLYTVVGTWRESGGKVNGMDVKVYLNNIDAQVGTFGLHYDPAVLTKSNLTLGATGDYTLESPQFKLPNNSTLPNPCEDAASGSLLVQWKVTESGMTGNGVAAKTAGTPQLIATINFDLASGVTNENYQSYVKADTLDLMDNGAFEQTQLYTLAKNYYDGLYASDATQAAAALKAFADPYWRTLDGQNGTGAVSPRLDQQYAVKADGTTSAGGFYQTMSTADVTSINYDTRMQITFVTFGASTTIQFTVQDAAGNPVGSADVTVTLNGTQYTGKTDSTGKANITVKGTGTAQVAASASGYTDASDTVTIDGTQPTVDKTIVMTSNESYTVKMDDTQKDVITLVGGDAYAGKDYTFKLEPAAGYTWPNGAPTAADVTITKDENGTKTDIEASKLTWDAAKASFVLDKSVVVGAAGTVFIVKVNEPTKVPGDDDKVAYKVTLAANGTDGSVSWTTAVGTIDKTSPMVNDVLTETLGAGGTESTKYTMKPDALDSAEEAKRDAGQQYTASVIVSMTVNGLDLPLTDAQKLNGFTDYQLTGITQDQAISVTFGTALVDGRGTPDPGDDVVEPVPPPTPSDDAPGTVTVVLSDYAKVASVALNETALDGTGYTGPTSQLYTVAVADAAKAFKVTLTDNTVAGATYVPDKIVVDGTVVYDALNGGVKDAAIYNESSKLITLSGVPAGTNHNITVTYKEQNSTTSIFAMLNVVNRGTVGSASPMGTTLQNVGMPANVTITIPTGYQLDQMDLTVDSGALQDVSPAAPQTGTYVYTTPVLTAGTTTVGFTLNKIPGGDLDAEQYAVRIKVNYSSNSGATAANIIAVSATDSTVKYTFGPNETGAYHLDNAVGASKVHEIRLPAGTWKITVSKDGYLKQIFDGFVIVENSGTVTAGSVGAMTTTVTTESVTVGEGTENQSVIWFGCTGADTSAQKAVDLKCGDATWDTTVVNLLDVAQVAAGWRNSSTDAQKQHANLNEDSVVTVNDMNHVVDNYGQRHSVGSYADFMTGV